MEQRVNLAYEDELKLAGTKGMSVEVTSAPIDIGRDDAGIFYKNTCTVYRTSLKYIYNRNNFVSILTRVA